jgi:NADPH2:quinone reductase
LTFTEAAAVPLALITAWESLFERAGVQAGQKVLVHGGAGGVGHLAIQLAKQAGAGVCTTVSSETKATFVNTLGADEHIFYRIGDFAQAVLRWTDGQGVDVALDTVGGQTFEHTFAAVSYGGGWLTRNPHQHKLGHRTPAQSGYRPGAGAVADLPGDSAGATRTVTHS